MFSYTRDFCLDVCFYLNADAGGVLLREFKSEILLVAFGDFTSWREISPSIQTLTKLLNFKVVLAHFALKVYRESPGTLRGSSNPRPLRPFGFHDLRSFYLVWDNWGFYRAFGRSSLCLLPRLVKRGALAHVRNPLVPSSTNFCLHHGSFTLPRQINIRTLGPFLC